MQFRRTGCVGFPCSSVDVVASANQVQTAMAVAKQEIRFVEEECSIFIVATFSKGQSQTKNPDV